MKRGEAPFPDAPDGAWGRLRRFAIAGFASTFSPQLEKILAKVKKPAMIKK